MSMDTNVFIKYTEVTLGIVILFFAKFEFKIMRKTKIKLHPVRFCFL